MTIPFVGTEFTPDQDTGEMEIRFQLPVSTRAELTADTARKIVKVLYDKEKALLAEKGKGIAPDKEELDENGNPTPRTTGVRFTNWRAGRASSGWGNRGSHIGQMNIKFIPMEERPYSTAELGERVLSELRQ